LGDVSHVFTGIPFQRDQQVKEDKWILRRDGQGLYTTGRDGVGIKAGSVVGSAVGSSTAGSAAGCTSASAGAAVGATVGASWPPQAARIAANTRAAIKNIDFFIVTSFSYRQLSCCHSGMRPTRRTTDVAKRYAALNSDQF
jgi:hypothetical protein